MGGRSCRRLECEVSSALDYAAAGTEQAKMALLDAPSAGFEEEKMNSGAIRPKFARVSLPRRRASGLAVLKG